MPPCTVLLTGFDAFGGEAFNPSWLAAERLHAEAIRGHTVQAALLPTVFGQSLRALDAALRAHRPALVICLGLAASRNELSLERVALNVDDARMADNAGQQPVDVPVVRGGPVAYFSTLPIKAMAQAINAAGLPAGISQTAGTYVCNHVFYGLMHRLARRRSLAGVRGGFVHVPALAPADGAGAAAGTTGWTLPELVRALRIGLDAALAHAVDVPVTGGALA